MLGQRLPVSSPKIDPLVRAAVDVQATRCRGSLVQSTRPLRRDEEPAGNRAA
ncbi:hypothetical protein ACFOZ7_14530 [Natribaculum luteum]|uniref:Uncharacterized protein n=1 Tax=Natribaculum luteum TaxID=1586232 RepID=A0ABD5P245_9EURY|nr:hypothetical protein [Natribaculum luteum]